MITTIVTIVAVFFVTCTMLNFKATLHLLGDLMENLGWLFDAFSTYFFAVSRGLRPLHFEPKPERELNCEPGSRIEMVDHE